MAVPASLLPYTQGLTSGATFGGMFEFHDYLEKLLLLFWFLDLDYVEMSNVYLNGVSLCFVIIYRESIGLFLEYDWIEINDPHLSDEFFNFMERVEKRWIGELILDNSKYLK